MTKADLIAALSGIPDECEVLVDVAPWDEPLSLAGVATVQCYPSLDGTQEKAFATITPSTQGATRLDPSA